MKIRLPGFMLVPALVILAMQVAFCQYGPNDLVLQTQAQVDAFDPTTLQGKRLVIAGNNITNVSHLSTLTQLNGLAVENNPLLTSLAPLNSLTSIDGPLTIISNATLTTAEFTGLQNVLGLTITGNGALTNLSGFPALINPGVTFDDMFTINSNPNLVTISGFNALTILPSMTIDNNAKLTTISGFQNLIYVYYSLRYAFGSLEITNNPVLTNIDGFLKINRINYLKFTGNSAMKDLHGFTNLHVTGGGGINISNNAKLENLDALSNLETSYGVFSGGSVLLQQNPLLTKPCGIYHYLQEQLAPFDASASRIDVTGSGFHIYQLLACGGDNYVFIPPPPLIRLGFNEQNSVNPINSGSLASGFTRSPGTPLSSPNVPGAVGGANSFDFGTTPGNYFVESNAVVDGLKNLDGFTLTGWLNAKASATGGGGNRLISWINAGGDGVDLVYQNNGSLRLGVDGWPDNSPAFSSAGKVPTNAAAPTSNWVFFAVTYQSNGQVQFYFGNPSTDATLDVTKAYPGPGVTGSNIGKLAIGAFNSATRNAGTYDRMFRGLMDDIQVFDQPLDYEKILAVQHNVGSDTRDLYPPSAPTNLTLVSKNSNAVSLSWTPAVDNTAVLYYELFINNDANAVNSSTTNSMERGYLLPNTAYSFTVKAIDAAGNVSAASQPLVVTTSPAYLHLEAENYNVQTGVSNQGTTVGNTDAGDWIGFTNVNFLGGSSTFISTRYAKGNSSIGNAEVRIDSPISGQLLTTLFTGPTGGWGVYNFELEQFAVNVTGVHDLYIVFKGGEGNGNFDYFELSGDGSQDVVAPSAPTNLVVTTKTSNAVVLAWTASTDNVGVAAYDIFNGANQTPIGSTNVNNITINSLPPGTTFALTVKAKDGAGNYSAASNAVTVTTDAALTYVVLQAESYNSSSGIANQGTTIGNTDAGDWIRFNNVNLGNGYATITTHFTKGNTGNGTATVRYDDPFNGQLIGTITTTPTGGWGTYAFASAPLINASGTHNIYVSWATGEGNANYDWFQFSGNPGSDTTPPVAPTNVVLVSKTSTTISLSWTASTDNVGVQQYDVFNGNSPTSLASSQTSAVTIANLLPNTAYALTVKARDDAGNYSNASTALSITTNPAATGSLIHLAFDESAGSTPVNTGSDGASFTRNVPQSSGVTPVNVGGALALQFGTTPQNYYVESNNTVDALKGLSAFTLTGWVNSMSSTTGGGGNRIISWINGGGDGVDLVYQNNGSLRLGVDGWPDASPAFSSAGKVPTNAGGVAANWVFFAVTYQSNGQVQFYFGNNATDATLDVTRSYPTPGVTGTNIGKLAIGAFNSVTRNSGTYDRMFRGLIDDIQINGSALTLASIIQIQRGTSGSPAGRMDMSVASTPVEQDEVEIKNELFQNYPNPFADETEIGVSLTNSVKVARITLNDLTGREMRNVEVVQRGKTSVIINSNNINTGMYFYSLIVDGKVVDVKRMVLSR